MFQFPALTNNQLSVSNNFDSPDVLSMLSQFGSATPINAPSGGAVSTNWFNALKGFPTSEWGKAILGTPAGNGQMGTMGLGNLAIGGLSALSNLWMGMKQLDLQKDQLNFSKDAFAKNWGAQVSTTNNQLADRQAARVASNAGAYESVDSYMKKYGIKG